MLSVNIVHMTISLYTAKTTQHRTYTSVLCCRLNFISCFNDVGHYPGLRCLQLNCLFFLIIAITILTRFQSRGAPKTDTTSKSTQTPSWLYHRHYGMHAFSHLQFESIYYGLYHNKVSNLLRLIIICFYEGYRKLNAELLLLLWSVLLILTMLVLIHNNNCLHRYPSFQLTAFSRPVIK